MAPVNQRILALDVVRGFAAFGILMVNIQTFGGPYPLFRGEPWTDTASQAAYAFVDFAFVSKFFPLFSFLFGVGLSLQFGRAESTGASPNRLAYRRLAGLLIIGVVHAALLSTIDILVQYAFIGLLLLPLRRVTDRTVLRLACAALAVPVVLACVASALDLFDVIYPSDLGALDYIAAYGHGSLRELWTMRAHELRDYYAWISVYAGWEMLAMVFVGAWAVRVGLVEHLVEQSERVRSIRKRAFSLGVPAAAIHAFIFITYRGGSHAPAWAVPVSSIASAIGEPTMAVGYASTLALLVQDPRWARRLTPVANLGRLALSSYVLQSAVMSLTFFSFGLGYYGTFGPFACIGYVVCVYLSELALAHVWSLRFRYGPLEAAWRAMTYGRWPGMRSRSSNGGAEQ